MKSANSTLVGLTETVKIYIKKATEITIAANAVIKDINAINLCEYVGKVSLY